MDAKTNPVIPEKISIESIHVTHSSIDYNPDSVQVSSIHGFDMNMGHNIAYNFDDKMCRVRLRLEFIGIDENHNKYDATANFNIECHFKIANIQDCVSRTKKGIQIDKVLPATLLGMAYSTMRGIVLERTSNTLFNSIILPVIDPMAVLDNEDFKITKERA